MSGDEKDRDFAEAMRGVAPLGGRDKLRRPPEGGHKGSSPSRAGGSARPFVVEREGDDVFARGQDVARKQLAELRAGRVEVGRELDLHGMDAAAARHALLAAIMRARDEGVRCLLVIHGAGYHSEAGPVLKALLPDWLQQEEVAGEILAFATAPTRFGGPGASLVLLRRTR